MKISKRTIIIFVVGVLAVAAALVSLYLEKQAEIEDLESINDEITARPRRKKPEPEPEPGKAEMTVTKPENDGSAEV